MRSLLFVLPFTLNLAAATPDIPVEKRIANPFYILSSESDSTLDDNHSLFEIRFTPSLLEQFNENIVATPPAIVELSCNGVIQRFTVDSTLKTTILVSPGTYIFQLAVTNRNLQEIFTDSITILPHFRTIAQTHFWSAEPEIIVFKPVIYLYPPQDEEVTVALQPKGAFTFTYPAYADGWKGTAHPDGSITIAGKHYPYLFWEGTDQGTIPAPDYGSGFFVKQAAVVSFLEEKLTAMGLSDQEKTDFITFWGPRMSQSEQGFAHFLFNKDYEQIADLSITPAPQEIFRVYLLWTPLDDATLLHPQPQAIPTVHRSGFYAIEWGGSEVPFNSLSLVQH